MDTGLKGKVALVTAASKGLGRAAALALASEGASLAICARGQAALRAAADGIRAATGAEVIAIDADVTRPDDITRTVCQAVDRFGGLDILVTNAGGPRSAPFEALTDQDWRHAVDLLLLSVVRLSAAVVPHMRRRGGGRIIHITSMSVKQPIDGLMLSNSIRAAVVGFAKTLSNELAADRILVNCVAPGYTRTDRVVELNAAVAAREGIPAAEVERRLLAKVPLGRLGEPRELADLIVFLASERSSYITGTTIPVDGGFLRGLM